MFERTNEFYFDFIAVAMNGRIYNLHKSSVSICVRLNYSDQTPLNQMEIEF